MRPNYLTVTLLALSVASPGAWASDTREEAWQLARKDLYENNAPLAALNRLEGLTRSGWLHSSVLGQFHTVLGDLIGAEALFYASVPQDLAEPSLRILCEEYDAVPAVPELARATRGEGVVFINESHHVPLHRAFAMRLMGSLNPEGVAVFAAETFSSKVKYWPESKRYPSIEMGVYVVEPMFGDLIRTALAKGYFLAPFEQTAEQLQPDLPNDIQRAVREQSQAGNLAQVYTSFDPALLLVLSGGGHIRKRVIGNELPMMAYRFTHLTGAVPFSIDQVGGTPSTALKLQSPLYRGFESCGEITQPTVYRKASGELFARDGYDVTVFFPHQDFSRNRASWLVELANRQLRTYEIEADPERTLVRAFVADEPEDAVPADQILVAPSQKLVTLALASGRYRLVREWKDGANERIGEIDL